MMPRLYLVQRSIDAIRKTNLHVDGHKRNKFDEINHTNPQNKQHGIPTWLELPPTGITEIFGEAGTGKTQVSLGLCVSCTSRSNSSGAIRLPNTIIELVSGDKSQTRLK